MKKTCIVVVNNKIQRRISTKDIKNIFIYKPRVIPRPPAYAEKYDDSDKETNSAER